jgi:hypothetical protein
MEEMTEVKTKQIQDEEKNRAPSRMYALLDNRANCDAATQLAQEKQKIL